MEKAGKLHSKGVGPRFVLAESDEAVFAERVGEVIPRFTSPDGVAARSGVDFAKLSESELLGEIALGGIGLHNFLRRNAVYE